MPKVSCVILGGGRGTRLYPLTKSRSKPAVPIAGKYRLIDIPISNCLHSGMNRIFVLTQFNSVSLHRHITRTYHFDGFSGGFVEVLAAQQTIQHDTWYQGTADAVRRNMVYISELRDDLVLILSGDQLYRMDFQEMVAAHIQNNADVTIATLPLAEAEARSCGIMRADAHGRVTDFVEKPKTRDALERIRTDPSWFLARGSEVGDRVYLGSMGIYLFRRSTLEQMLSSSEATDFGKEIFPQSIESHRVQTYLFDSYWEDIGTIGAFHKANIDLTREAPPFDFMFGDHPVYTRPRYLPCSRLSGVMARDSLIADGCVLGRGSVVENSVIGVRAQIAENVTIRNSYLMGADSYESAAQILHNEREGRPCIGVGAGSVIENAIIDKHARIGRDVRIQNAAGLINSDDHPDFVIRDKIVVIPRHTVLRDGTII